MDKEFLSVANAPKTSTFQMKINPEVKRRVESVYSRFGLTLTDAVNLFIQQSLNEEGLPFLASPENIAFQKWCVGKRLVEEAQKGFDSAEREGWLTIEEVEARLELSDE
ncbi:MAG: type II toxin-antitoxin system RelB/DinJ family antitoxin [Oscillospiraceae bacterium]|nr:type II toxin-antitoxin system RelB/DinJ family antitoxin [Oscillospiraceae bacterium]